MNIYDLLIIYFSVGAPFGVYAYLQNNAALPPKKLWFKTLSTFFFWIPSAFRLLLKKPLPGKIIYFDNINDTKKFLSTRRREKNIHLIQKRLEKILRRSGLSVSIYEFRETVQRYAGLTFACRDESEKTGESGKEFLRAAKSKNVELGVKCFYRRNRRRLLFHQSLARQDFLKIISNLFVVISDREELFGLTSEFLILLKDFKAQNSLEKIFTENSPSDKYFAVKSLEKDLWKPETRKPSAASSISTLTRAARTAPNSRKKD